jgi:hypothetical protein
VHNFFAVVNPPMATRSSRRKRARLASAARALNAIPRNAMRQKPAFHRHFCSTLNFSSAIMHAKNFLSARFADDRGADAVASGARHLHTILSGVTVIFFLL